MLIVDTIALFLFAVMTFLFGGELSFLEKARIVAKLAVEHASNLAAFAALYKVKTYEYCSHSFKLVRNFNECESSSNSFVDDVGHAQSTEQQNESKQWWYSPWGFSSNGEFAFIINR